MHFYRIQEQRLHASGVRVLRGPGPRRVGRRGCDGFFIVTMTLYRWSAQSLRTTAIVVTHAHSLPPRWGIAGTEIAG